ncbi:MAG TPA: MBL fold metallo-hydrolase [Sporichthya sp.]|nr:MBL fold metallo-hydrolase [Sporichthya sp.]
METTPGTTIDEIADKIFRISTFVPDVGPTGFTFNQFLIDADEPAIFHTGPRMMFPLVSAAIETVRPVADLRWITFGHLEADECGGMNHFLASAPNSTVAHGAMGCMVSYNDLCDRAPRPLADGEVLDIGGRRLRHIDTPHVPHGWDARVLYEEVTGTLFCGDLFSHLGGGPAVVTSDVVEPADAAETMFAGTSLTPNTAPTIRRLADLEPRTLAIMHGSSFSGDCAGALRELADRYATRHAAAG